MQTGLFITLEGAEGAGKTTQAQELSDALRRRGRDVCQTREPGGTPLGEILRRVLKDAEAGTAICADAELFLFAASRAQLMQEIILPQVRCGGVVVCDRFADSTTVYQGAARGLAPARIEAVHDLLPERRWPDLTVVLDIDAKTGLQRRERHGPGPGADRFEMEPEQFHERVRAGFLALARACPDRVRIVRADRPVAVVHQEILEIVDRVIG